MRTTFGVSTPMPVTTLLAERGQPQSPRSLTPLQFGAEPEAALTMHPLLKLSGRKAASFEFLQLNTELKAFHYQKLLNVLQQHGLKVEGSLKPTGYKNGVIYVDLHQTKVNHQYLDKSFYLALSHAVNNLLNDKPSRLARRPKLSADPQVLKAYQQDKAAAEQSLARLQENHPDLLQEVLPISEYVRQGDGSYAFPVLDTAVTIMIARLLMVAAGAASSRDQDLLYHNVPSQWQLRATLAQILRERIGFNSALANPPSTLKNG